MNTATPVRKTGGRAQALALISALALVFLTLVPTLAQAAVKDAITSVTVNPDRPKDPINQWDQFDIRATWAAPEDAVAGDTFELTFPGFSEGVAQTFDLKDESGAVVGRCSVESTKIVCTFTDYVESHDKVKGNVYFRAQAIEETSETEWVWNLDSEHPYTTTVPGGVGPANFTPPETSEKWSWQTNQGDIRWVLMLRGNELLTPGGQPVTLTDTFDSRLTLDRSSFGVEVTTEAEYRRDVWTVVTNDGYTATLRDQGFDVRIHDVDPAKIYRVFYTTPTPPGTLAGDSFTNEVQANGADFLSNTYVAQTAGGDGGGDQKNGSVSWSKVDPDGAALAGSEWTLTPAEGPALAVIDNGMNDADPAAGSLKVTGLAWGEYTLAETRAPAGYELTAQTATVTIDGTHLSQSFGEIENARTTGALTWHKVNEGSTPLAGSEWIVTGPDGSQALVVDNGENDKDPAAGSLKITGLLWGSYSLKEYKAPAGYELSTQMFSTEVGAHNLSGSFGSIVNSPTPGETVPTPSETTPTPSETTPNPSETTPEPSETTPNPSETTPEPSETTPNPSETTPTPSETTPEPSATPSSGTPTEATTPPSGIVHSTRETTVPSLLIPPQALSTPPAQHGTTPASTAPSSTTPPLASTGAAITGLAFAAGALLIGGLTLYSLSARRRLERRRH